MKRLVIMVLEVLALLIFIIGASSCSNYQQQPMTAEGRQILLQGFQQQNEMGMRLFEMNMETVRRPPWRP